MPWLFSLRTARLASPETKGIDSPECVEEFSEVPRSRAREKQAVEPYGFRGALTLGSDDFHSAKARSPSLLVLFSRRELWLSALDALWRFSWLPHVQQRESPVALGSERAIAVLSSQHSESP